MSLIPNMGSQALEAAVARVSSDTENEDDKTVKINFEKEKVVIADTETRINILKRGIVVYGWIGYVVGVCEFLCWLRWL